MGRRATYESSTIKGYSFRLNISGELVAVFEKHADVPGPSPTFTLAELDANIDELAAMNCYADVSGPAHSEMKKVLDALQKGGSEAPAIPPLDPVQQLEQAEVKPETKLVKVYFENPEGP